MIKSMEKYIVYLVHLIRNRGKYSDTDRESVSERDTERDRERQRDRKRYRKPYRDREPCC